MKVVCVVPFSLVIVGKLGLRSPFATLLRKSIAMPITAAYEVTQSSDCTTFRVADTTDYGAPETQAEMTNRVLQLYTADGELYEAIDFNYDDFPDDEIDIENLTKDYAFTIVMTITPATPVEGSVYVASDIVALVCFSKVAFFERQNRMVMEPSLINNDGFLRQSMQVLIDIEAAKNAEADDDILGAQNALDRIQFITENDALGC